MGRNTHVPGALQCLFLCSNPSSVLPPFFRWENEAEIRVMETLPLLAGEEVEEEKVVEEVEEREEEEEETEEMMMTCIEAGWQCGLETGDTGGSNVPC